MRYVVITNHTDLRVHWEPDVRSRIVGALAHGFEFESDAIPDDRGWLKLAERRYVAARFLRSVTGVSARAPTPAPAPPRHLLIFYGGYESDYVVTSAVVATGHGGLAAPRPIRMWSMIGGREITQRSPRHPDRPRTSYTASVWLSVPFRAPSMVFAMDPSLDNGGQNLAVGQGLTYVREHASRGGRLVLYGFSAGGYNALNLARRIAMHLPQFPVDLLITVDANVDNARSQDLGPLPVQGVRKHLNFYQTIGADGYKGNPMRDLGENSIQRDEIRLHDLMPVRTADAVVAAMKETLHQPTAAVTAP